MTILALDCAPATGWAVRLGDAVESGTQAFELRRGESQGMRYMRFRQWLRGQIAAVRPQLVVYEAPVSHHPGAHAAEMAYALTTRVMEEAARAGVEYTCLAPAALKRFATGKGVAEKPAMVAEAQRRYPGQSVTDHNQADALLLLAWVEAGMPELDAPKKSKRKAAA